jgi:hypothetical protein
VPNTQRYAFILELRNPFHPVIVVGEDDSLIAVVGSRYFDCCRRECATAVFRLFRRYSCWLCFNSKGTKTLNYQIIGF